MSVSEICILAYALGGSLANSVCSIPGICSHSGHTYRNQLLGYVLAPDQNGGVKGKHLVLWKPCFSAIKTIPASKDWNNLHFSINLTLSSFHFFFIIFFICLERLCSGRKMLRTVCVTGKLLSISYKSYKRLSNRSLTTIMCKYRNFQFTFKKFFSSLFMSSCNKSA